MEKNSKGLYIHIPFCLSKCPYCDFYSVIKNDKLMIDFCEALISAIEIYTKDHIVFLDTIYFGGGTPSVMPILLLKQIMKLLKSKTHIAQNAEISIEVNPNSCNFEYLLKLKEIGFNRISIGIQSFNDTELKSLGRIHNSEQGTKCIFEAKNAGFDNISIDLMLGVPNQTSESLEKTLAIACALPINHVSTYMLKIEENTHYFKIKDKLSSIIADDDQIIDLYYKTISLLENSEFEQYEISNFAIKGYECKHNLKYWRCEEYLAIGPGAHFFNGRERGCFDKNLESFIESCKTKIKYEIIDSGGDFEEYFMLKMRLCEGVDFSVIKDKFKIKQPFINEMTKKSHILEKHGLIEFSNHEDNIAMTRMGFSVSNSIITYLLA